MDIYIINIPSILTYRYSGRIQASTVLSRTGIYEEINLVLHISRCYINRLESWPAGAGAGRGLGINETCTSRSTKFKVKHVLLINFITTTTAAATGVRHQ